MDVPRLSLRTLASCVVAIIALIAGMWLIAFDEASETRREFQRSATPEASPQTNPERARTGARGSRRAETRRGGTDAEA